MGKGQSRRSTSGAVEMAQKFTFNAKEGIDNPVMIDTEEAEPVRTPCPRLCVLKKEEGESYRFHLRVEAGREGHIIRNVVSGGVAERCGLRDGDRLLEVNNRYVDDVDHPEVATKIKMSGNQLCLLVMDGEEYEQALLKGHDLRALIRANRGEDLKPPRLVHVRRDHASGVGVKFTPVEGEKGHFSVSLVAGGAAARAGVCRGDRLVWMNGAAVSDLTHSALNRMVKKCGNHMTILVIDRESERSYRLQKMPILPCMAVPLNLPHRAKKLHLDSGLQGYGFLLRLEKTPAGRTLHVLRDIYKESPAERAGVQDGDLLLEVNGEAVEALGHDEIVDRVRQSGRHMSITTITAQGLDFYSKLGLPPLLFLEDGDEAAETQQHETDAPCKPRLCSLQKGPLGYGFNLGCDPRSPGTFISQVAFGGPGLSAGLRVEDVVIEVNGQNVEDKYLEDVILLVKEGGHFLSLLVMNKSASIRMKQPDTPSSDISDSEDDDRHEISCL